MSRKLMKNSEITLLERLKSMHMNLIPVVILR
jgi:hypothetical protein